jgi:hypothetical protein
MNEYKLEEDVQITAETFLINSSFQLSTYNIQRNYYPLKRTN